MTPENFTYWLQGYLELSENLEEGLSKEQVEIIQEHISLVLTKVSKNRKQDLDDLRKSLDAYSDFHDAKLCGAIQHFEFPALLTKEKVDESFDKLFGPLAGSPTVTPEEDRKPEKKDPKTRERSRSSRTGKRYC